MGSRLLWRRSATAVGIYAAALLGFLGQLLAARALGPREFGLLAIVFASTGFFQSFLDLTVEEALIKYGFRYSTAQEWGKLRRLFGTGASIIFKGSGFYETDYRSESYKAGAKAEQEKAKPAEGDKASANGANGTASKETGGKSGKAAAKTSKSEG